MDNAGHPIETGTVTPVSKGHPHRASRHWVRAAWRVTPAMLHPYGGRFLPATALDRLAVANCPPGESWAGLLA